MLTIEDRKELAEVLRDLAVLIKEDTRISSHAPIEVVNEVHTLVNRVAAKYRRWADALVSEEEEDERPIEPKQSFGDPTSWKLADRLYAAGYDDCKREKDYDPRGCEEWHRVVDCFESLADKVNEAREANQPPLVEPEENRVPKAGDTVWCFISQSDWEGYWPAVVAQPMPGDPECSVRVTFFNFGTRPTTVLRRIENLRLTDPNLEQAGSPK